MKFNKNRSWTFYIWVEQEVLVNQAELTLSFITFKKNIRRVIYKKGKQLEHLIHKITIIEYPKCKKIVEENKDYYCLPARKEDFTPLNNILQQDTTHSESQILSDLTKEWYSEFQDRYKILI